MAYDYDLIILGGGSGGVALARRAASYGAKVAICEQDRFGGTCVHRGCVPKKLLVYGATYATELEDAAGYGWSLNGSPSFDWGRLIAAKDKELDRLNAYYNRIIEESGVARLVGSAAVADRHTVTLDGRSVSAERLVIAVGGRPFLPKVRGIEWAITSDEAFHLESLPARVVLIGSGYIGVEFAGIFRGMGSQVSLTFRSPLVLPKFDHDLRSSLQEEMTKRGIAILPEAHLEEIRKTESGLEVVTDKGVLSGDVVMCAAGRVPNTRGIGLEALGLDMTANGSLTVDEFSKTNLDNVYAIGDCTGRVQLTPVAIAEGRALAETLFNNNPTRVSYDNIPTGVFSQPPIGTVGLSEEQARAAGHEVLIYRTRFRPMKHTLTGRDEKVMLKLVVDKSNDRVLGCHMLGEAAPEIMQAMGVALSGGATKAQFDRTIALHPSTAEEFVLMREPVAEAAVRS